MTAHTVYRIMQPAVLLVVALFVAQPILADAALPGPPRLALSQAGATIDDVTIQTFGVIKPDAVRQYLSLKKGDRLQQDGVDRDFHNLSRLAGFIPRLEIEQGEMPDTVTLNWIVMAKWLQPTSHPFYADPPLLAPIQGVGFILTSPQTSRRGASFQSISQLSRRANLIRVQYNIPAYLNPAKGRQSNFLYEVFGGRGVYRASQPLAVNIYSWVTGAEILYLIRDTRGTQLELGARAQRSTTAMSTGITSPFLYPTNLHPSRNTLLEAGYAHACPVPPTQWYPPHCYTQYRFEALDAIGGLGATNEFQIYIADAAQYIPVRLSTLAFHVAAARTGGVLPDSFLVCTSGVRGYPKAFCGTDAQTLQVEYRLSEAVPGPLHFVLFTETAASRIRGGSQVFALPAFQWHADSGIGLIYRGFRLDYAYGTDGGRLTFELQGQSF